MSVTVAHLVRQTISDTNMLIAHGYKGEQFLFWINKLTSLDHKTRLKLCWELKNVDKES